MKSSSLFRASIPKFFESILPLSWRQRPEPNPDRNDHTLARIPDTDPVYRAFIDYAYLHLEKASFDAADPQPPINREFLAGRVHALVGLIQDLELHRGKLHQAMIEEQRLAANRRA